MGWKLIDRPKTLKVTKALAKQYAEMDPAPHDRPLSERRLQVYQRLLAAGQFRPVTWASALCKETSGVYRVNGKHTSVMLSGLEKVPDFYVTIEEYECDTLEDVARLYATFDSKMMSRTANDIYLSFAGTVDELRDIPGKLIALAINGVAYHRMGHQNYQRSQATERAEMILDTTDFVQWFTGIIQRAPRGDSQANVGRQRAGHLLRMSVVAAMFATYQKSRQSATTFWEAVRDETGAKPELPDRKLARYLCTTSVSTGGKSSKRGDTREMYVKSLHAWNAWRKGETTNLNYHPDKDVPTVR